MAKLTLTDPTNFNATALSQIANNNNLIEAALENTLSRDGTSPNQMEADLDLNHNDIINVSSVYADRVFVDNEELVPETIVVTGALLAVNNLDDLDDVQTARENLGIGGALNPIVIVSSGQSNMTLHPAFTWSPSDNLFLWNFDGVVNLPGFTASSFSPMTATSMGTSYSYADEAAKANPTRPVYLVNISRSATGIDQWLPGAGSPDMFASLKNNVEAALAVIGVDTIDEFLWWQGETAPYDNYVNDFAELTARLRDEAWFPEHTPITMFGVSSLVANSGVTSMTQRIRECVNNDPERIAFVDTAALPVEFWDPTAPAYIHLNATGYNVAGRLGYLASHYGRGQGRSATPWRTITKRHLEPRVSDTVLTDDAELRFFAEIGTYRIRMSVIGATVAAADFKWGFIGPTVAPVISKATDMTAAALTTENVSLFISNAWPTTQVLSLGSGVFLLSLDILATTTAAGEIVFQWAQNVSDAGTTSVYKGSYLDYMLID